MCRFNLTINLAPADEAVAAALRAYREAVSDATQVRFPDFHSYQFHMSLGYRLIELTPDEQADLEQLIVDWQQNLAPAARTLNLPAPQLTFFDDMTRFVGADERNSLRSR
ncbi:MAG: hypothetical protein HC822_10320 [Oscillochloris sp.]|nr:hypothetical protein [Oscillochloris sp.]